MSLPRMAAPLEPPSSCRWHGLRPAPGQDWTPMKADVPSAPIYRHVPPARAGERLVFPAAPAVLEAQPRDARHQIELARPRVPGDDRRDSHPGARQHHVALVEALRHGIMATDVQTHLANVDAFRIDILVVAQAVQ